MTRLHPKVKQAIKKALDTAIYANVNRRQDARLLEIIRTNFQAANALTIQHTHESFSYKGAYYSFEQQHPRFKNQRLVPELQPVMDAFLAEKQLIAYTEMPYVFGLFTKVLNTSNSLLDYVELLPECMHLALRPFLDDPSFVLPRELTDEQVDQFKLTNHDGLMKLKKRMVLDLITV